MMVKKYRRLTSEDVETGQAGDWTPGDLISSNWIGPQTGRAEALYASVRQGKTCGQFVDTLTHLANTVKVLNVHQDLADHVRNRRHLGLFHPARGGGGRARRA